MRTGTLRRVTSISIPHTRKGRWPGIAPGRLAAPIPSAGPVRGGIALLGLPDDLGVRLNGGRPGAAGGPDAFRAALARFGVPYDGVKRRALEVPIFDAGDVEPALGDDAAALDQTHRRVTDTTRTLHESGMCVVCVGGGHDLTFASARGLAEFHGAPLGGINVDPHLDVREAPGSGMPYRALLEGGHLLPRRFVELGTGRFVNTAEHSEYCRRLGVTIVPGEDIHAGAYGPQRAFGHAFGAGAGGVGFVSIDLDCLDSSVAPGVSAPCPMGLTLPVVAQVADLAGRCREVRHFDLMELCPAHDEQSRTARVAAMLFVHFVAGFAERGVSGSWGS